MWQTAICAPLIRDEVKKFVSGILEKHICHLFRSSRVKYRGASVPFLRQRDGFDFTAPQ